jgi:hypothetical protein
MHLTPQPRADLGQPAGSAPTSSAHRSVFLPFANPYIHWPPNFDYLSHFASSTLAFPRIRNAAKFQKGKNGQGTASLKLMMYSGVEDETVGY